EFASASRLSAFSTTFKLERHLRFNQFTQCANCQQFGHHTLKCSNAPSCHWCAWPHPTRDHCCPSSTCQQKGRLCPHTSPKCVTCAGPQEAHSSLCPRRQPPSPVRWVGMTMGWQTLLLPDRARCTSTRWTLGSWELHLPPGFLFFSSLTCLTDLVLHHGGIWN